MKRARDSSESPLPGRGDPLYPGAPATEGAWVAAVSQPLKRQMEVHLWPTRRFDPLVPSKIKECTYLYLQ